MPPRDSRSCRASWSSPCGIPAWRRVRLAVHDQGSDPGVGASGAPNCVAKSAVPPRESARCRGVLGPAMRGSGVVAGVPDAPPPQPEARAGVETFRFGRTLFHDGRGAAGYSRLTHSRAATRPTPGGIVEPLRGKRTRPPKAGAPNDAVVAAEQEPGGHRTCPGADSSSCFRGKQFRSLVKPGEPDDWAKTAVAAEQEPGGHRRERSYFCSILRSTYCMMPPLR